MCVFKDVNLIISEKQIQELMLVAHVYVRLLEDLSRRDSTILSECGSHNKIHVAKLLMEITNQQSKDLKVIE